MHQSDASCRYRRQVGINNAGPGRRAWLGRRIGGGTWSISRVALAMLLDGQERTLRAYHAGDRVTDLVAGYFARVGLAEMVDA